MHAQKFQNIYNQILFTRTEFHQYSTSDLKLNKEIAQGVGSVRLPPPPSLKLRDRLTNRAVQLKFPVKLRCHFEMMF